MAVFLIMVYKKIWWIFFKLTNSSYAKLCLFIKILGYI